MSLAAANRWSSGSVETLMEWLEIDSRASRKTRLRTRPPATRVRRRPIAPIVRFMPAEFTPRYERKKP